jgi:hypothetical protein
LREQFSSEDFGDEISTHLRKKVVIVNPKKFQERRGKVLEETLMAEIRGAVAEIKYDDAG